jgi:hypothetical protein
MRAAALLQWQNINCANA